jgi:uncharacterized membrane protein YagU involved in acid resistance
MKSLATAALKGGLAGVTATVPMTLFMTRAFRQLPREEQYPLPPRIITMKVLRRVGTPVQEISEPARTQLTLLSHFGYGALCGVIYSMSFQKFPLGPVPRGILFGSLVWAGSYQGFLPALGILRPVTEQPLRRTVLMLGAHFIWGLALGILCERKK